MSLDFYVIIMVREKLKSRISFHMLTCKKKSQCASHDFPKGNCGSGLPINGKSKMHGCFLRYYSQEWYDNRKDAMLQYLSVNALD